MPLMLALGLPDVVFGRERKLLMRRFDWRRSVVSLWGRYLRWHLRAHQEAIALLERRPAIVEIAFGIRHRNITVSVTEGCTCRD